MPKTEERAAQRARVELRRQRREQGLCIECGKGEPVGSNGGDFILRCDPCLTEHRKTRKKSKHHNSRFVAPPKRKYDPDYDFFSTRHWKQFVRDVDGEVTDGELSQREIREKLKDLYERDFLSRYIGIALGQLESAGQIRAAWGVPTRYTKSEPVVYSLVTGMAVTQARRV